MQSESKGVFSTVRCPIFLPDKDHQPVSIPSDPVDVTEEFLLAQELLPDKIYEFDIGEDKFRSVLTKQNVSGSVKPLITDQYFLYQYVLTVLEDGRTYSYSQELVSENWNPKRRRYQRVWKRQYFPEDMHDLDSYLNYHLIVRSYQFQIKNRTFEILVPRKTGSPCDYGNNFWIKLRANCELEFPEGTKFVIKEIRE